MCHAPRCGTCSGAGTSSGTASARSADELAKKLANPVAHLISVTFQGNLSDGFGDGDGQQSHKNIQHAVPISIGGNRNLPSRTILPVVSQSDLRPKGTNQAGLGNATHGYFFSPENPTKGGLIRGVGAVLQISSATEGIATGQ